MRRLAVVVLALSALALPVVAAAPPAAAAPGAAACLVLSGESYSPALPPLPDAGAVVPSSQSFSFSIGFTCFGVNTPGGIYYGSASVNASCTAELGSATLTGVGGGSATADWVRVGFAVQLRMAISAPNGSFHLVGELAWKPFDVTDCVTTPTPTATWTGVAETVGT